ncbi:hypothetical protein FRX31_025031 [Thalictrum thalictroides]|uniref:Uncharacterized protein n=1 Tax=Thalictrum thalictroides TaxID=46969 RepID=A0A7J6VKX2_THATH|nr:hypothetical protein FRX31_025031 [Thalictrum thalictroides]
MVQLRSGHISLVSNLGSMASMFTSLVIILMAVHQQNESAAWFDEKYEVGDRLLCRDVESNGPETSQANE